MKHHRSPTQSYPHTHHASLALRHPTPTLLSPLSSIPPDDLQSNAWLSARPPLSGLGITYFCDTPPILDDHSFGTQDSALHPDHGLLPLPADIPPGNFPTQAFPYQSFEPDEDPCAAQFTSRADGRILGLDSDIDPAASDMIGLIPDVNMYDKLRRRDVPHAGINPMDTISGTSLHDIVFSCGEPVLLTPKDHDFDNVLSTTDTRHEQSPSPRVIQDIMSILVPPAPALPFLPWSFANTPSVQNLSPAAPGSSTSIKPEPAQVPESELHPLPPPCSFGYSNTTHPSPILNAHLGIELAELISRAERYRTKYPERDIDRTWLSHFAGKLSDRGELLNDFRCYVIGCDQRNKRRDHILVHVGAHIGQRPFACSVCPLRFLRKNECKRHEASHSGFRPYSCDICGQTFVRQDLVKRHVKRTHGFKDENQPVVPRQPRKKARLA